MVGFIHQLMQRTPGYINRRSLGVAAAFSARVAGAGLGFLFSIMLARLLGSDGTGVYFLALTIVSIGATVARLGLDNAVLRFAAVAYDQSDRPALAALYRKSFGLVVMVGGAVALVAWLVTPYLPLGGERSGDLHAVLPTMLIALIPSALILLQGEFFKAIGLPGKATLIQAAILPMLLVLGSAVLLWEGNTTVHDIALVYVMSATLAMLLAAFTWSRSLPRLWGEHGNFDTRLLLRTSLPLLWVASMNLVMGWTDILVLGAWTNSATVGVYGIATRVAALTAFILVAVNSVTAPRFAALYAQGNHVALSRLAQRSAAWMLLAASPVVVVMLLFPNFILQLFGTDFVEGLWLLRILALGQLVNVAVGSVGYLLMMTGHERLMRNNVMLSALLNLLGNLVLVPIMGATGAAISTAISLAFMNLVSFFLVYRKLRINTFGYFFVGVD